MSTVATMYTQTADWLSALRRWLPQTAPLPQSTESETESEEMQQVQCAFHCAYRRFAQRHPHWVSRRFDDEFLRRSMAPAFADAAHTTTLAFAELSGYQLAWSWDREFGALLPEAVRTRQVAELIEVANYFLQLLRAEPIAMSAKKDYFVQK